MAFQRSDRVAEAIKHEVGAILLHRIKDSRVDSARVSVTDVEVTRDLRHATIFVSILGDEEEKEAAIAGLRSAAGFVRSEIGKSISLRATPEVHFKLDTSIERGANITALLNRIKAEESGSSASGSNHDGTEH
jgi:ribosome-binding factor A